MRLRSGELEVVLIGVFLEGVPRHADMGTALVQHIDHYTRHVADHFFEHVYFTLLVHNLCQRDK